MSQWGQTRTIDGAVFVPHLDTASFVPEQAASKITGFIMSDCGSWDLPMAMQIGERVSAEWIGRTYSDWLTLPQSPPSPAEAAPETR